MKDNILPRKQVNRLHTLIVVPVSENALSLAKHSSHIEAAVTILFMPRLHTLWTTHKLGRY